MDKHQKQIQKLKEENNSLWDQLQAANKEIKKLQGGNNRSNELQGETMMLNKTIMEMKNKEIKYLTAIEELRRQNSLYSEAVWFYANTSSWKILVDDSGGEYALVSRSDEEVIEGRIKGGKRAREAQREIGEMPR